MSVGEEIQLLRSSDSDVTRRSPRWRVGLATVGLLILTACGAPPPPPVEEEPPTPGLLWSSDLESGDLSQFDDTPWNIVEADSPTVVNDPDLLRDGQFVMRTAIPGAAQDGDQTRSEVVPATDDIVPGDDLWFRFSTFLDEGFPVDASWQVIAQWKNEGEGSPPLSLNVEEGEYRLGGGDGHPDDLGPFSESLGTATPGVWVDWVAHIVFSPEQSGGYVEIWRDGEPVLPRFTPETATLYPTDDDDGPSSYLKLGYYRNPEIPDAGAVFFDDVRIGMTRESVSAA